VPGVEGVAHGLAPDGKHAVLVWVSTVPTKNALPAQIEGYPVIVENVPGGFHPQ